MTSEEEPPHDTGLIIPSVSARGLDQEIILEREIAASSIKRAVSHAIGKAPRNA